MIDGRARVAFLGPLGTFSHAAVDSYFADSVDKLSVSSIDEVFLAVETDRAEYGVVPVENSTEGAVTTTQECLIDTSLRIMAEIIIPVVHNVLISPEAAAEGICRVVSHRQSLAQCRGWLKKNWPGIEQREVSSNAEAARLAAADKTTAAIAGLMAAETYGLSVLAAGIQDRSNNSTRFLVIARESAAATGHDKTSILVYAENKPGALFRVLEPFATNQVSLTRIETRPARDDMWAYVFFIDFEGHENDEPVRNVFAQLQHCTVKIKNLGSYPAASSAAASSLSLGD
ncbi:MAG: prephenate dehydratase [Pseudomonadales bacterium]|nr:prephenate dehydratase [Pseudomonadales bacterium]